MRAYSPIGCFFPAQSGEPVPANLAHHKHNSKLATLAHHVYERAVIAHYTLGSLTLLGISLLLWQWIAARRFPLHQRIGTAPQPMPAVTLLKPLKGADAFTENCLRSWFTQEYSGPVQILFGVASASDPVCEVVRALMKQFPQQDAELIVVEELIGPNAKVSKLVELEKRAKHGIIVVSDADVRVPSDFLQNAVAPLANESVGLVNCFYRLQNPQTLAMRWEAVAINADFWSQVLQSKSLKPLDFALGAVMLTRRSELDAIGGFRTLADCLADDYQLGNRIARNNRSIVLCPVVVECWDPPMSWAAVWKHQLRWARTIRVSQPVPYFFSVLSNSLIWPLLWAMVSPSKWSLAALVLCATIRIFAAADLQWQLTRSTNHLFFAWMAPLKDLLQFGIWLCAFLGNTIEWRGRRFKLRPDGTLSPNPT